MILPKEEKCTGCGACANTCPVNAIEMKYSTAGFLVPVVSKDCINCKKCERICPSLNEINNNSMEPKVYSVCANDDIRRASSSGGMFTLLANWVLEKKGYVCGASFDDKFQLGHRIIHSENEMSNLRGSKYLQSNTSNCYSKIKTLLDRKEYVLFSGTPCQVAGLSAYLGKEYNNLFTVDLICTGVPSQKFFNSYLKSISGGKKIEEVKFRDKKMGWNCNNVVVKFQDSTEYIGRLGTDPYISAFKEKMMLRKSCYDCKYSDFPRRGDFTIGDLWHADKLDPKSDDKKGTSLVLLNNKKAERIFEEIKSDTKSMS